MHTKPVELNRDIFDSYNVLNGGIGHAKIIDRAPELGLDAWAESHLCGHDAVDYLVDARIVITVSEFAIAMHCGPSNLCQHATISQLW
jgi:hypothetical protein